MEGRSVRDMVMELLRRFGLIDKSFDELTCEDKSNFRRAVNQEWPLKMGPKKILTAEEEKEICDRIRNLHFDQGYSIRDAQQAVRRQGIRGKRISLGTVRRIWQNERKRRRTT